MFGLSSEKIIILLVIAAVLLGPERLPGYAKWLANFVKKVRKFASDTKSQLEAESGEALSDVDWRKLDPRQYDPRRIIREALLEEDVSNRPTPGLKPRGEALAAAAAIESGLNADDLAKGESKKSTRIKAGENPPFDNEAT